MKIRLLICTAFFLVALYVRADINFLKQPAWEEVLAKASAENKFIFVDAYTDWCYWCKVMDKNTFPDTAVASYLGNNFVCVKMEMETGFGAALSMKYHVMGFPSYLVFTKSGQLIGRSAGYQKPSEFLKTLHSIVALPVGSYPTGISTNVNLPFPDFYKKSFIDKPGAKRELPDSNEVKNYLKGQSDLSTEVNWNILHRFTRHAEAHHTWILENTDKLIGLYGKDDVLDLVGQIIDSRFQNIVTQKNEAALENEIFPMADRYFRETAPALRAGYKLTYYRKTRDYAKTIQALNELIAIPGGEYGSTVNDVSWFLYENTDDQAVLKTAAGNMKNVIATEPQYAYLDTYAALLYKTKDYKAAKEYADKAIAAGKKDKEDISETEKLLAKIKAAAKAK